MSTKLPEPLAAYFAGHNNPEEVGELLAGGERGFAAWLEPATHSCVGADD